VKVVDILGTKEGMYVGDIINEFDKNSKKEEY
jgi:hypothetical protein